MECCRDVEGSPISTEELWRSVRVTTGFLVTSLTKALLPRLLSLVRWPAQGRVLVVPYFFHLRMMEATMFLGTFNAAEIVWCTSTQSCLGVLQTNHVQSIELTTGGLQSSCRNISRMINGNWMHLSSKSSLIAKGLNK
jgi:hypothetical protein